MPRVTIFLQCFVFFASCGKAPTVTEHASQAKAVAQPAPVGTADNTIGEEQLFTDLATLTKNMEPKTWPPHFSNMKATVKHLQPR